MYPSMKTVTLTPIGRGRYATNQESRPQRGTGRVISSNVSTNREATESSHYNMHILNNVHNNESPYQQNEPRFRLPIYHGQHGIGRGRGKLMRNLPRAATAITPSGESYCIPIDDRMYSIGPSENVSESKNCDDCENSSVMSVGLESRSLSPASSLNSPRRPLSRMKRTSGHDSDSSESYWPGDDDVSDSEMSVVSECRTVLTSEEKGIPNDLFPYQGLNFYNSGISHPNTEHLRSIETVVKNLINFEPHLLTQNNSALVSRSNESNESEGIESNLPGPNVNELDVPDLGVPGSLVHTSNEPGYSVPVSRVRESNVSESNAHGSNSCGTETSHAQNKEVYEFNAVGLETDSRSIWDSIFERETTTRGSFDECSGNVYAMDREHIPGGYVGYEQVDNPGCSMQHSNTDGLLQGGNVACDVITNAGQVYFYSTPLEQEPRYFQTCFVDDNELSIVAPVQQGAVGSVSPMALSQGWSEGVEANNAEMNNLTPEAATYWSHDVTGFPFFTSTPDMGIQDNGVCSQESQVGEFVNIGDLSQAESDVGEMMPLTGPEYITTYGSTEIHAQADIQEADQHYSQQVQGTSCQTDEYLGEDVAAMHAFTESQIPRFIDPEDGLPYPALHVTDDGLITVILRKGVFLEMTPEKAIRLVNHEKKLVVALTDNGSRACVIHPGGRICQAETTVNAELYFGRKAKMTTELIMFGNKMKTYKFDYNKVEQVLGTPFFRDLSQDESVFFMETNSGFYNNEVLRRCHDIMSRAYFHKHQTSGSKVIINGAKITQNDNCDVTVYMGSHKYVKMNPTKSIVRLKSPFIEIDIEANWNIKVKRGSHTLNVSHLGCVVSNGKIKASLDNTNKFKAFSLPDHRVLMLGQPLPKRRPGVGPQRGRVSGKMEPEADHQAYGLNAVSGLE